MSEQVKKTLVLLIYIALAVGTLAVFWQVRNFDFINYDDNQYVYENPHVLNGLTHDATVWAFTTGHAANWHPLTWLSLMLDCQLFGLNPGRMHLVNLFLHIANTLLLFAVLKKMTGSLWPSAFVAAAFAIHPMHVESVAWIAERKDVLSTLFMLLTLAAYVSYVRRRGIVRYLLTMLLFALGLMAKPMLVTLPFLLLLLDYWPLNRFDSQSAKTSSRQLSKPGTISERQRILYRIIIEKIPFFVLAAASSIITFLVQREAMVDIKTIPLIDRVGNTFLSYVVYLSKMFWPQNLAIFYPFDADDIQLWHVLFCALLMIVVSVLVIYFGRRQRYLLGGWFWFVGTLVPVIGIVQVGGQAFADRYTYIPYIGLFILIAWGMPDLLSKWRYRKFALGISAAIALTALGICARVQVSYWNNSNVLFSHAIEVNQNNYIAYYNLGTFYGKLGRNQDAVDAFKQAVRIKPDYAEVYNNLGSTYGNLGRFPDAVDAFKKAVEFKPEYAKAYCNLGVAYNRLGRFQDAVDAFKQAVKIKPDYAVAHHNLGVAYFAIGDKDSAMEEYKILKTMDAEQANKLFTLIRK